MTAQPLPSGFSDVSAPMRELRATATDPGGNIVVELDGLGRLVDLTLTVLALAGNPDKVANRIRAVIDDAFAELERARAQVAEQQLAAGTPQLSTLTTELTRLADQSRERFRDAMVQLERQVDRLTGTAS